MSKNEALARVRQLKRQVVIGSVILFLVVVGFITNTFAGWAQALLSTNASDNQNQGGGFFNQGNQNNTNNGGSNVGSSSGSAPVSGSGGS
jgi:hypothetical protein